jgi:hypothetical protein
MRGQLRVAHGCLSSIAATITQGGFAAEDKGSVISVVPVRFTDREVGLVSPLQFQE